MIIIEKKRRAKRKYINWELEIAKGHTDRFYNSREWDILREEVLKRDKGICQFFAGKWNDGKHFPEKIKLIDADTVHHIIPIRQRPDLALDINNCISLSFEAHEIIEDRHRWSWRKRNKPITKERW